MWWRPGTWAAARAAARDVDGWLVCAGAGMSADSGIPVYRGRDGTWRSAARDDDGYSALQRSSAELFFTDPDTSARHHANRWAAAQAAAPHPGYAAVASAQDLPAGVFVCTTNIDSMFVRAGLDASLVQELHGTLARSQCLARCGQPTFQTPAAGVATCPTCGSVARPNVILFEDYQFDASGLHEQAARLTNWLKERADARLGVLEVGVGQELPVARRLAESVARARRAPLIRVNPERVVATRDLPLVHVRAGARDLRRLLQP